MLGSYKLMYSIDACTAQLYKCNNGGMASEVGLKKGVDGSMRKYYASSSGLTDMLLNALMLGALSFCYMRLVSCELPAIILSWKPSRVSVVSRLQEF